MFPLVASLLPAAFQIGQGIYQKSQAKKLKESTFIPPELLMNRDLAQQQAFSRRAPGAAQAESNVRRNLATTIAAGQRSFGGDANKVAAITAGANAQANDANAQIAAQGQQFSENAFGRIAQANNGIAAQKRQNRMEFNAAKAELLSSSNQNIFNGINNAASAGLTSYLAGDFAKGGNKGSSVAGIGTGPFGSVIDGIGKGDRNSWSDYLLSKNGYLPMAQDVNGVWRMPGMGNPMTQRMMYSQYGRSRK
jgi:hypothetical protein